MNNVTGKCSMRIVSMRDKKKVFTVALGAKGNGEKLPALYFQRAWWPVEPMSTANHYTFQPMSK